MLFLSMLGILPQFVLEWYSSMPSNFEFLLKSGGGNISGAFRGIPDILYAVTFQKKKSEQCSILYM